MSTGTESLDAVAFAKAILVADAPFVAAVPGGVHLGLAPQASAGVPLVGPLCILWPQSSVELLTFNANRIWTDGVLMVKVSGQQDTLPSMRTAAARASALLSRATGASQGASIISCVRTRDPFLVPEPALIAGVQWLSLVALFRVLVV